MKEYRCDGCGKKANAHNRPKRNIKIVKEASAFHRYSYLGLLYSIALITESDDDDDGSKEIEKSGYTYCPVSSHYVVSTSLL